MTDPFATVGPAIVNVSGGRTSAMMLRRTLDAHRGVLPENVHVVFCNTGRERVETLDFVHAMEREWSVPIHWLERDSQRTDGYRDVSYETASRDGEPFAALIREKSYLPNAITRFCTVDLKILTTAAFAKRVFYGADWTSIIGFRRDEPDRVSKLRDRENEWSVAFPLFDAKVHKADVLAFWKTQPFDLRLKPHESNCDLCFFKSYAVRFRLVREHPELAAWWIEQERLVNARFKSRERGGYAALAEHVRRQPSLPIVDDDSGMPCGCTDRRVDNRVRCTCRNPRGRGHKLSCATVLGGAT